MSTDTMPAAIIIFGSALRTPDTARDVDVAYTGCDAVDAVDAARRWAKARGLGSLPIDAHAMPVRAVWEDEITQRPVLRTLDVSDPVAVLSGSLDDVHRVDGGTALSSAIRLHARHGYWPPHPAGTRGAYTVALEPGSDEYAGDGLDAVRNALRHHPKPRHILETVSLLREIINGAELTDAARACGAGFGEQQVVDYYPGAAGYLYPRARHAYASPGKLLPFGPPGAAGVYSDGNTVRVDEARTLPAQIAREMPARLWLCDDGRIGLPHEAGDMLGELSDPDPEWRTCHGTGWIARLDRTMERQAEIAGETLGAADVVRDGTGRLWLWTPEERAAEAGPHRWAVVDAPDLSVCTEREIRATVRDRTTDPRPAHQATLCVLLMPAPVTATA